MLMVFPMCGADEPQIDGEKLLTDISEDERAILCRSTLGGSFFDDSRNFVCHALSIDEEECDMDAAQCNQKPIERDTSDCGLGLYVECSATVAEIEACYAGIRDTFRDFSTDLDCSNFTERLEAKEDLQDSPACLSLEDKCPRLLEDDRRLAGFL